MKLVREHMEQQHLNELKSEDVYIQNKKSLQKMIKTAMHRFDLSRDVAVIMLSRALEKAAKDM